MRTCCRTIDAICLPPAAVAAAPGGDPQLWHDALDYFSSPQRQPQDCSAEVGAGPLSVLHVTCSILAVHVGSPRLRQSLFGPSLCDCPLQVQELLSYIEDGAILPPLVVLQSLSKNPGFRLSLVKDYVTRQLQADSRCD